MKKKEDIKNRIIEELAKIPGITKSLALKLAEKYNYDKSKIRKVSFEELENINGIGKSKAEDIKIFLNDVEVLISIPGITKSLALKLAVKYDYDKSKIRKASLEELENIEGIGKSLAISIKKNLLNNKFNTRRLP